jgi:hypothetical protein
MATRTTTNRTPITEPPYWALDAINATFHDDFPGISGNAKWVLTQRVGGDYVKDAASAVTLPCLTPSGNVLIAPHPSDGTEVRLDLNFEEGCDFYQFLQESFDELNAIPKADLPFTKGNNGNRQEFSTEWTDVPGWSIKVVRTIIAAKNAKNGCEQDFTNILCNLRRRPVTWSPRKR